MSDLSAIIEAAEFTLVASVNADVTSDRKLFRVPAGLVRILDRDLNSAGILKRE